MSEPRRRPTLLFLIALAGTAIVLGLGALSFERRIEAFQPLGFEARSTPAGTFEVTAVGGAGVGVKVGDQILLAGGAESHDAASLRARLRRSSSTAVVVARGEKLETVEYQRPPLQVDWRYLLLSLIAGVYLLIGLFTLLREPQRPALLFTLWCLASAAVYLLSPLDLRDLTGRAIYLVEEIARLLLPPITLHLFLVFPPGLAAPRWKDRATPFLYLPGALLLALQADLASTGGRLLFGSPTAAALARLDRLELAHLAVYAVAAVLVLALRLRRHPAWEERRQLQWIALGLAAGYLPFVALYLAPEAAGWQVPSALASAAVLPLAIVPLTFAWAILRYKLWDLGPIVRDAAAYTITILVGLLAFSLVNLGVSRGVPEELALARNLLTFAAGLGLATLMVPTKRSIAASLERLQYGGRFTRRRALADAGRDLLHERDLDALCAGVLRHLEEGLDLERANLFLAQGGALVPVRPQPGLPTHLALESLGASFWESEVEPLSGAALPQAQMPPAQRLFLAGFRYAFPLVVRGSRVGIVLASHKRGHAPLSSEDLDLVRSVLNQAALAIENAQLVDQLQRRLEDVLRLEQQTQGILESTPAGIAVLDSADRVLSTNLAFAALVGRSRARHDRPPARRPAAAPAAAAAGRGPGRGQLLRSPRRREAFPALGRRLRPARRRRRARAGGAGRLGARRDGERAAREGSAGLARHVGGGSRARGQHPDHRDLELCPDADRRDAGERSAPRPAAQGREADLPRREHRQQPARAGAQPAGRRAAGRFRRAARRERRPAARAAGEARRRGAPRRRRRRPPPCWRTRASCSRCSATCC